MHDKNHQGFLLVEVLVAWFILTCLLVSVWLVLLRQNTTVKQLYRQFIAVRLADNLLQQLNSSVSSVEVVIWRNRVRALLPESSASIHRQSAGRYQVCLTWWGGHLCRSSSRRSHF